jgi:hypothetical protein
MHLYTHTLTQTHTHTTDVTVVPTSFDNCAAVLRAVALTLRFAHALGRAPILPPLPCRCVFDNGQERREGAWCVSYR